MSNVFYIAIDSDVRNNLEKYFAPLKAKIPTGEQPFNRLIQKMEQYHDQNAPKFWDEFKKRIEYGYQDSVMLLYMFERIEETADKVKILFGTWTNLIEELDKFNSAFQIGTVANTPSSNEFAIRKALNGICKAINELNQELRLNLPFIKIKD